jgi:small subunit ribosomal protein S8
MTGMKRVSSPGRRVYRGKRSLPWVLSGLGIAIVSTPRGVMTGQEARRQGVGGEVLCYIW